MRPVSSCSRYLMRLGEDMCQVHACAFFSVFVCFFLSIPINFILPNAPFSSLRHPLAVSTLRVASNYCLIDHSSHGSSRNALRLIAPRIPQPRLMRSPFFPIPTFRCHVFFIIFLGTPRATRAPCSVSPHPYLQYLNIYSRPHSFVLTIR